MNASTESFGAKNHQEKAINHTSVQGTPGGSRVHVVVVHYKSGGMLLNLVRDLVRQEDTKIELHVVECGDDGSVSQALSRFPFRVTSPGMNLGYCGGNNLVLQELVDSGSPVCLINPDVRLPDSRTLRRMSNILASRPDVAAVAPSIRTIDGRIEYTGSEVELRRAHAVHTGTHVHGWSSEDPAFVEMPWVDGACWMLRSEALREVGSLDERFFLFSEEVDWCVRASLAGWRVGVLRDVEIHHARSSSFGGSTKGAYYAWRNMYLLCKKHEGYGLWVVFWLRNLLFRVIQRGQMRSGHSAASLRGARDAVVGRSGRMRGDE